MSVRVVDFDPRAHAAAFREINLAWIARHFVVEAKDRRTLDDPQGAIIDTGGAILMAQDETGTAIGAVALIKMADGGYELSKMGVMEAARGRGVGRALMDAALNEARVRGAARVYIETNSSLAPALALYQSAGFRPVPDARSSPSPYDRCDVRLELVFEPLVEGAGGAA